MIKSINILSERNINFHKRKANSFEKTICHCDKFLLKWMTVKMNMIGCKDERYKSEKSEEVRRVRYWHLDKGYRSAKNWKWMRVFNHHDPININYEYTQKKQSKSYKQMYSNAGVYQRHSIPCCNIEFI